MKKFVALLLALVFAFTMAAAVAEETVTEEPVIYAVEDLFEGVWVQFEQGFELYMPAEWYMYEISEEMAAKGIMFHAGTEDMSHYFTLVAAMSETPYTLEQMQAELVTVYTDAELIEANGVGLVRYTHEESGVRMYMAVDELGTTFYTFTFYPIGDTDFDVLAALISSTIRNIEVVEE